MSPDPGNAGSNPLNPQSWNAYAYVNNNPLNATDPTGMFLSLLPPKDNGDGEDSPPSDDCWWCWFGGGGNGNPPQQPAPPQPPPITHVSGPAGNGSNYNNCVAGYGAAGASMGARVGWLGGGAAAILGSETGPADIAIAYAGKVASSAAGTYVGQRAGQFVGSIVCSAGTGSVGQRSGDENDGGGGKNGWTNQMVRQKAKELGFNESKGASFNSHGQPTFKSGNRWITPDIDGHSGIQTWKMFNSAGRRIGTYSTDLSIRLGN